MGIQRDYILRIIEEFFKALARILKLTRDKQYDQALKLIDETALKLVHFDLQEFERSGKNILDYIKEKELSFDQVGMIADLFKAKADIFYDTNMSVSAVLHYERSLCLFQYVQYESKNYSLDRAQKILEIRTILQRI